MMRRFAVGKDPSRSSILRNWVGRALIGWFGVSRAAARNSAALGWPREKEQHVASFGTAVDRS